MDFNKLLLDTIEESVCIINREHTYITFNESYKNFFYKVYGAYPVLEEKRTINLENDFDVFVKSCVQRVFSGETFKATKQVKDIYWEFSFTPIYDKNNEVEFLMLVIKETTQTNELIKTVSAK